MKAGMSLEDLLRETIRRKETKRDFIVPTDKALVRVEDSKPRLAFGDVNLGINDVCHGQIAEHTKIPKQYYDKMKADAPELLANNVNEWFRRYPAPRMVRSLDNMSRAFMSDRYRPLDDADLLEAALPPLLKMGVEVVSADVTERKLYLKVVDSRIKRDLPAGTALGRGHDRFHTVCPALVLSNSEVGCGALAVQTSVWEEGCTNLMIIKERSTRKYHVGGKHEIGEDVYAMLSDTTRKLTDAALWAQIGDIVQGAFDRAKFDATCEKLTAATKDVITGDAFQVVELTAKKFGFNETEKKSVLQELLSSGELSRYGLQAAITRVSADVPDYDRASDFERFGGEIIELPKAEWRELAEAA